MGPPTVCFAFLASSVELGLLLPPVLTAQEDEVPQTPETDSPSITDCDVSPTHQPIVVELEDSGLENGLSSINTGTTAFDQDEQDGAVEEAYEAIEEGPEGNGLASEEDTAVLSPPLSPGGPSPVISREPSTFSLDGDLSSAISVTKDVTKDAISASLDLTKGAFSITKDAFSMLSRGSGMSKLFSTQAREQGQRSEESSPSSRHKTMKQSHSQQSFDSAILDGSLPDENLSIDSDLSDNFVVLIDSECGRESVRLNSTPADSGGILAPGTEGGSSADLSSSLSQSTEDLSQEMSSVLLLILSGIACTLDMRAEHQVVAVQAQSLTPVQMGNISQSDILAGLVQAPSEPVQGYERRGDAPALRMRVETGPSAALAESSGFLDVRVQDCRADLLASTVANIGPFLEDEFSVDGQPMKIYMSNITITMKDDAPRIYPTAPQPVPAKFIIDHLLMERSEDGIMRVKTEAADVPPAAICSDSDQQEKEEQTTESQLCRMRAALTQALQEKERLLLEVRKYNPAFTL